MAKTLLRELREHKIPCVRDLLVDGGLSETVSKDITQLRTRCQELESIINAYKETISRLEARCANYELQSASFEKRFSSLETKYSVVDSPSRRAQSHDARMTERAAEKVAKALTTISAKASPRRALSESQELSSPAPTVTPPTTTVTSPAAVSTPPAVATPSIGLLIDLEAWPATDDTSVGTDGPVLVETDDAIHTRNVHPNQLLDDTVDDGDGPLRVPRLVDGP